MCSLSGVTQPICSNEYRLSEHMADNKLSLVSYLLHLNIRPDTECQLHIQHIYDLAIKLSGKHVGCTH